MVCFEKQSTALTILFSFLLLCCDGASDLPSSTVNHKNMEVQVRKLLNLAAVQAAVTPPVSNNQKTAAPPVECSESLVAVSQAEEGPSPGGTPSYSVVITNTCASCVVTDVHVSCGEFGSAKLVDPTSFRRVTAGDCLVAGGGAIQPGESISFDYSNTFAYDLEVTSVSCSFG